MRRKTDFIRIIALLAAIILLASCQGPEAGVKVISSVSSLNIIEPQAAQGESLHYAAARESYSETVASSGLIEMRLDRATNSFAIYDTSAGLLWSSLPILEDAGGKADPANPASLVTIKVLGGTDVYVLNSQDNSLAYGTAGVTVTDKGAVFTYDIYANENAALGKATAADIGFKVRLIVSLADGNMTAECNYENLTGNKDAYIDEIEVLNFFGAYNDMGTENFLFVPDGCGAIIRTAVFEDSFESLSFPVYGADPSASGGNTAGAIIPSFGIKSGAGAFAALIEKGDAAATIRAEKASDLKSYNRAYASFNVYPYVYSDNTLRISKSSGAEDISLCYRFLSANNATYAGMASAVREQLIRNGVLSTKTAEETEYLPFFVTVNGTVRTNLGRFEYTKTVTDFGQAQDMLIRMKNKGINNVFINYGSVFSGSTVRKRANRIRLLRRLGNQSDFDSLCDYVNTQKMKLYIGAEILSGKENEAASDIYGEKAQYTPADAAGEIYGTGTEPRYLRKTGNLRDTVIALLSFSKNSAFGGYCIKDCGKVLYSDYSRAGSLRGETASAVASAVSPLSTGNSLMVDNGNFYMLKNADSVINLPLKTSVSKSGAYEPVPFVPLVLHGFADYTGEAVNLSGDPKEAMLRAVEYGACPHYMWNYTPCGRGEEDVMYYDNSINSAAEFYTEANEVLNDLREARMTDHYEVSDGVFCTEYDNGAMVFVNYTSEDYPVLGITVGAGEFRRVN